MSENNTNKPLHGSYSSEANHQPVSSDERQHIIAIADLETAVKNQKEQYQLFLEENKRKELLNREQEKFKEILFAERKVRESNVKKEYEAIKGNEKATEVDKFINYISEKLNGDANRKIAKNDIINVLLCLSQGFLTILAGEPGTGKTSLIKIIATILGLNHKKYKRYIEIPVGRGWTSKRDFIGYYNPLSKIFESSNKEVVKGLESLNLEVVDNSCKHPFIMLLDEANLSPMEYYWSDFMGLCDDFKKQNRSIELSNNKELKISNNLRFVATINIDHTTE
ncbi:MAG: ATP-binding protein [Bacillota bacterium]